MRFSRSAPVRLASERATSGRGHSAANRHHAMAASGPVLGVQSISESRASRRLRSFKRVALGCPPPSARASLGIPGFAHRTATKPGSPNRTSPPHARHHGRRKHVCPYRASPSYSISLFRAPERPPANRTIRPTRHGQGCRSADSLNRGGRLPQPAGFVKPFSGIRELRLAGRDGTAGMAYTTPVRSRRGGPPTFGRSDRSDKPAPLPCSL